MRYQVNSAISKNKEIIKHILSNRIFIYYCSLYRDNNNETLSNMIFDNIEFIEDMKKIHENMYIIKIHLDISLKMHRRVGAKLLPRKSKSGDWLDIFYDSATRSPTSTPVACKKIDSFSLNGGDSGVEVSTSVSEPAPPKPLTDKNDNIFYNIFCGLI